MVGSLTIPSDESLVRSFEITGAFIRSNPWWLLPHQFRIRKFTAHQRPELANPERAPAEGFRICAGQRVAIVEEPIEGLPDPQVQTVRGPNLGANLRIRKVSCWCGRFSGHEGSWKCSRRAWRLGIGQGEARERADPGRGGPVERLAGRGGAESRRARGANRREVEAVRTPRDRWPGRERADRRQDLF